MSIDYIEPVPVLSSCQRMLVVDVRTRSRLFIHWFRPNFSDLVYNGHQGPDTFTPDRHLQLLWFQVGIHPLNIPEKARRVRKVTLNHWKYFLFFWYQNCKCGSAWQIFHINNFLLPRSWRFERLYSVWFCFSARSEFPTEIGFWGFWIGGLSFPGARYQEISVRTKKVTICSGSGTLIELETKVKRRFAKILQSLRRPLLGPSPGWKRPLVLSHLIHY